MESGNPMVFFDLTYRMQHSTLVVGAETGIESENFSGTDQSGSFVYSGLDAEFTHDFSQYLTGIIFGGYRYEDREDPIVTEEGFGVKEYNVKRYEARAELRYTFWQYYFTSFSYRYTESQSERISSDYDEHPIVFSIGVEK